MQDRNKSEKKNKYNTVYTYYFFVFYFINFCIIVWFSNITVVLINHLMEVWGSLVESIPFIKWIPSFWHICGFSKWHWCSI